MGYRREDLMQLKELANRLYDKVQDAAGGASYGHIIGKINNVWCVSVIADGEENQRLQCANEEGAITLFANLVLGANKYDALEDAANFFGCKDSEIEILSTDGLTYTLQSPNGDRVVVDCDDGIIMEIK